MILLDGKIVSLERQKQIAQEVEIFKTKHGRAPGLAVILVGDHPASQVYVRHKISACERVGIRSLKYEFSKEAQHSQVAERIEKLNQDDEVDGILLQLPLPPHLNAEKLINCLDPRKDPDGLTIENLGLLWASRPRVVSCTPSGVMEILKHYQLSPAGQHAVVVGRSLIVGKPMAQLLLQAQATVTICHSQTVNLYHHTRQADILIVAAGRPEFLGKEAVRPGVVVVDVGIHRLSLPDGQTRLVGDVRFAEVAPLAKAITPVPGGVGPMTITMLLANTLSLARQRHGEKI